MFDAYGVRRVFPSPAFWTDRGDGLLYLFHLHGFESLTAYASSSPSEHGDRFWLTAIDSWLAGESSRPRNPGWHPYPTSQRLIAWSVALSSPLVWADDFKRRLAGEIHRQARYLRRSVEHDIGGNHVLKNATALCVAGAVVPSAGVLDFGLGLLRRECARQFFPDGGHEKRTTFYHRQALADLGDVARLIERVGREPPSWLADTIERAARWQQALTGPDGCLPLLGDAWEGPALPPGLSEPLSVLGDSGYVVLRHQHDQLVIDAGALCPPHLPPHAHADCLSFVLWGDARPVITDPGSFTYSGPERDAFRGVRAHNTVQVEGREQCVFWGPFRAGFLPKVTGPIVSRQGDLDVIEASHDGYSRGGERVVHARSFFWWPAVGLVIVDRIGSPRSMKVCSRLCLADGLTAQPGESAGPFLVTALRAGESPRPESRDYSPALGSKTGTEGLLLELTAAPLEPFGWSLLREGATAELIDERSLLLRAQTGERRELELARLG